MRATCGMEMSISGGSALPAGPALVTTSFLPGGHPYCTRSTNVLSIFQSSAARQEGRPATRLQKACPGRAPHPGRALAGRAPRAVHPGPCTPGCAPGPPTGPWIAPYLLFFAAERPVASVSRPLTSRMAARVVAQVAARLRSMNGRIWVHEEALCRYPERAGYRTVQGQELS